MCKKKAKTETFHFAKGWTHAFAPKLIPSPCKNKWTIFGAVVLQQSWLFHFALTHQTDGCEPESVDLRVPQWFVVPPDYICMQTLQTLIASNKPKVCRPMENSLSKEKMGKTSLSHFFGKEHIRRTWHKSTHAMKKDVSIADQTYRDEGNGRDCKPRWETREWQVRSNTILWM